MFLKGHQRSFVLISRTSIRNLIFSLFLNVFMYPWYFPILLKSTQKKGEGTKVLVARHQNSGAPNVPDWSSFRLWWRSLLLDLVWKDHGWGSSLGAGGLIAGEESDLTKCQSRGKELSSWWVMRGSKMDMKKREEIPRPLFPLYFYHLYQNQYSFSWSKWSTIPSSFEKYVLALHIFYVIITWLWGQPPTFLPPSLQKIWKCWNCVLLCSSRGNNCGDNLYSIYMQFRKIK